MNNVIPEDFERESEKDFVYLHETEMEQEIEYWRSEKERKPAEIYIINQDKIPITNEPEQPNVLPF